MMPFFRYSAIDKTGAPSEGTVEAASANEAMAKLANDGMTVSQLMMTFDKGQAPPPKTSQPVAVFSQPLPPQAKPASVPKTPAVKLQPSPAQAKLPSIRTKPASDKDRMLLFAQISKQIRAGMGPAAALSDLQQRVPKQMETSVVEAAKAATNGQSISETWERYPDLYPESVIATIRAGEEGGFLEDAFEMLSDQSQIGHQFSRSFWWVRPLIINALVSIPLVYLVLGALIKAWDIVEQQGEAASATSSYAALMGSVLKQLLWPIGPVSLALYALTWLGYRYLRSYNMRRKRHEIILRWPTFGARTRHECLAVFSWVMSKLSNSGISPKRSWQLAAASVPNLAVKEKLDRVGEALAGHEKLSDAVFREKLFPPEYAPMIATAEVTGDIPAAFEQLSKISKGEFDSAQTAARFKSSSWGRAGCFLVGGFMMILLMWVLYYQLMPAILRGLE